MRVPGKDTPLVSLPEGGDGGRKYGLDLGSPGFRAGHNGMFSGPNRFYEPLAKGFEDVARATSMIAKDMLMREDHAKVNEALTRFTEGELTPFLYGENGEFTKQGEQALGGTNRVADFFKNTPNRYTEGLSKNALAAFGEQINSRKMAVLSSTAQHEAKERNAWEIGTMQAAAQSDADFALNNFGDDRVFCDNFDRAMQQWGALADKQGLSGEQKKMFMQQQATSLQVGRIARFAQAGDHVRAFSELKHSNLTADARFKAEQEVGGAYYADMLKRSSLDPQGTSELLGAMGIKPVDISVIPQEIQQMAVSIAAEYGVDPDFVLKVIAAESAGNPNAVSPAGARGLMQLMPATAKELGVNPDDPADNIRGGVKYLKQLLGKYKGNKDHALMAYNWGFGHVDEWLKTGKGKDGKPLPLETKAHVAKVLGVDVVATYRPTEPESVEDLLTPTQKAEIVASNNRALVEQRKQQVELESSQIYTSIVNQTEGMAPQDAKVFLLDAVAKIPDSDVQQNVSKQLNADLKIEEDRRAAIEKQTMARLVTEVRSGKKLASKARSEVNQMEGLTFEGRERINEELLKEQNKPDDRNRAKTNELLVLIDTKDIKAPEDITLYAVEHSLTKEQEDYARKYLEEGGNREKVTFTMVRNAYIQLQPESRLKSVVKELTFDSSIYDAVVRELPPGAPVNNMTIKKTLSNLMMDGTVKGDWFGIFDSDKTLLEAYRSGKQDEWQLKLTPEQSLRYKAELESMGVKPTAERVYIYARAQLMNQR